MLNRRRCELGWISFGFSVIPSDTLSSSFTSNRVERGGFCRVAHSAIPPLTDFRFRIPLRLKTIKDVHSVSAYNFWTVHSVFPPQKIGLYSGLFRHSANLETPQIGFKNYRGCVSHPLFGTVTPYKHCVPFHRVFCTIGVHCMVQLSPSDQNFCCRESFDGEALRRWHHYGEIISRINFIGFGGGITMEKLLVELINLT